MLRKQQNLTQAHVAQLLDVKTNTISNWENGVSYPSFMELDIIVKIFDISIDDFLHKNFEEEVHLIRPSNSQDKVHLKAHLNTHLIPAKEQGPIVDQLGEEDIVYGGRNYSKEMRGEVPANIIQISLQDDDVYIIYKVSGKLKADLLASAGKQDWQAQIERLWADINELKRFYGKK